MAITKVNINSSSDIRIKTHSHVSAAEKDRRRTVCYLQEAESS